jgi:hypothetical protein
MRSADGREGSIAGTVPLLVKHDQPPPPGTHLDGSPYKTPASGNPDGGLESALKVRGSPSQVQVAINEGQPHYSISPATERQVFQTSLSKMKCPPELLLVFGLRVLVKSFVCG